jgi:ribosomal protein S18 acetylase RimI-like enzyme
MPGHICIRQRQPSDIPELISILTSVHNLTSYPVDGPSSFPARFDSKHSIRTIVALHDSNLAGHAELQTTNSLNPKVVELLTQRAPIDTYVALSTLFVDPKLQGKGVGARLMQHLLEWSREQGKKVVLIVLEKDQAAIRMYEKIGFERCMEYFYENIHGVNYRAFLYSAPEQGNA